MRQEARGPSSRRPSVLVCRAVATLTLLRHGESLWNRQRRFAGWADVELTARGKAEAERAGRLLAARGLAFDVCFSSCLRRAVDTLSIVLDVMNLQQIPVRQSWQLNERHCGALQGLSVWEAVRRHGLKRVLVSQWGFTEPPPPLNDDEVSEPERDPRYAAVAGAEPLRGESLSDVLVRVVPYWRDAIVPELRQGKQTLVVAHRNTLRVLVKQIDGLSDRRVARLRIPTGAALVYQLDEELRPLRCDLVR